MYTHKVRKFLVIVLLFAWIATSAFFIYRARKGFCPFIGRWPAILCPVKTGSLAEAAELLRIRKDKKALAIIEKILAREPENIDALCGKAEILRRGGKYKEAESILNQLLQKDPLYENALLSLAYIRYQTGKAEESFKLVNTVLESACMDKENEALAYTLLGGINSLRAEKGWLFTKFKYGTKIQCYFLKAKELAPEVPEVRLGLGTFYLLAPQIIGGDLNKALPELEYTVSIAPDFATANARLAQAYKKKGDMAKYKHYIERAKELDPNNEAVKEIE